MKRIFIHSRPQNRTLQGADGTWPLSPSLRSGLCIPPKEPRALALVGSIALSILIFTGIGFCEEADFRNYTGYVNDYANILSDETKAKITGVSAEIENKTTSQLAVLTIDTTAPLDIETYAVKLFEKWGIGQRGKNNGVLILVAIKDRKSRIEVGYGLEGAIPDALAKNIIEKSMIPFFKKGDYDAGILQATAAVSKLIANEYNINISELDNIIKVRLAPKVNSIFDYLFIIFVIIILIRVPFLLFFPMPSSSRRRDYWYGGRLGGNSGGFGGGFSGGGGASGGW